MNNYQIDFTKLKPGNYNRKSTEDEDRQVLSLDSQTDEAKRISDFYKLPAFVEVFKESKSAKTEGVRHEFMRMMEMIRSGKIDAIVCWKADRLARNMTEGGEIIDLLSSGIIKAIITHDKVFYPWDNVMVLAIEFSQGKQFVKELSSNVKRGQDKKASLGIPHGVASLGFLNDKTEEKGNRKWKVDKTRLDKIKIILDKFLTGTYSAGKIHKYAIEELKLTTVRRKKIGGELIANSRIYKILTDPIYAGFFFQAGKRYELDNKLPRLITEEEHEKIKRILSGRNIPKTKRHETLYAGFIISPDGDYIGPDVKYQLICDCGHKFAYMNKTHCPKCSKEISQLESPKYLDYTFYYNVKKRKHKENCKFISENKINIAMADFVNTLDFSNDLIEWSKETIIEMKDNEIAQKVVIEQSKYERKIEFEKEKDRLRELFRKEYFTEDEYLRDLESLNKQYADVDENIKKADWYSEMMEIIDVTQTMKNIFLDPKSIKQSKREIMVKASSNITWDEKNLCVISKKSINTLVEGIKGIKSDFPWFEPKKSFTEQGLNEKTGMFLPVFSSLLPG